MNCLGGDRQSREQRRISKIIDRKLKQEKRQRESVPILLLLGARGSGKTTLLKLNIVFGQGYSENDRRGYVGAVHNNVLTAIQCLVLGMKQLSIKYENPANENLWRQIEDSSPHTAIGSDECSLISQLWGDAGVHGECYSRRSEFNILLNDSAKYFLDCLDRVCGDNYVPSEEDMLRVYVPTLTNVTEVVVESRVSARVLDVCQENAKKWSAFLGGPFFRYRFVLYVVDISEYDKVVHENSEPISCLSQSVTSFKEFVDSQFLHHSRERLVVFVLLNKSDIFKEKIMYSDVKNHFPAYKGPIQDYSSAIAFIKSMFNDCIRYDVTHHCSTVEDICALNSESTKRKLFTLIRDTILMKHIEEPIKFNVT